MCRSGSVLITAWFVSAAAMATVQPTPVAKPAQRDFPKSLGWTAATADVLAARGDAASLAAAALLDAHQRPQRADQASELNPESAAIAWVRLRACASTVGCDVRDAATAMRWIDADNAAAWLPTLAAAVRDRDSVEVDRILGDMARGRRFDLYWNGIVVMMFDALRATSKSRPPKSPSSDAERLQTVVGLAAAQIVPSFAPIAEACRDAPSGTERREACLRVAKLLQQGDTVIAEMLGCSIERRLLPEGSKEARVLNDHRHVLEWRMSLAVKYEAPLLPWLKNAHARWRVARMRAAPREQDVILAVLREQGSPLYPPEEHR